MAGFGPSPKDGGQIPMSASYVPNTGIIAAQGSTNVFTDASNNQSTPINLNLAQIGSVATEMANNDGMPNANLPAVAASLYSGGGPLPTSGIPALLSFDRAHSIQGKGVVSASITSTNVGDVVLTPTVAANFQKITPGQLVRLSGAVTEYNYVALSYTPSAAPATIPLLNPVVSAGNTTAKFDVFAELGPQASAMLPTGMQFAALAAESSLINGDFYSLSNADVDGTTASKALLAGNGLFNGTNFDRQRGNQDGTSILSASGITITMTSGDITNFNARGAVIVLNMSNVGTGSVTLAIQGKEPISGQYYPILTGLAVTTNSVNVYRVYPGLTAVANVTANDILPRRFRAVVTANNANATTYTVACMFVI